MAILSRASLEVLRRTADWADPDLSPVSAARTLEERRFLELAGPSTPVREVRQVRIAVDVGEIPAVVYVPEAGSSPGVIVWCHGGGWVTGSPATCEDLSRAIAVSSGCPVLAVDYRLAPEHPFPTPVEDCYAATVWAARHREVLGSVTGGGLVVGGDSSGGNLAAAVALMAADRAGPGIDLQVLAYPAVSRDLDSESRRVFRDGCWLTVEALDWFWSLYLSGPADGEDAYAQPLRRESLRGLPALLLLIAECDPLADDGRRYAERLEAEGVDVRTLTYPGAIHGFLSCGGVFEETQEALAVIGQLARAAMPAASGWR